MQAAEDKPTRETVIEAYRLAAEVARHVTAKTVHIFNGDPTTPTAVLRARTMQLGVRAHKLLGSVTGGRN